ncbi:NADAR [uncultured Caudovirales phage]|uniref:NADAR n=1 Tax=uncultured Caudovirales phage TaxID=2100421 RepID=A0A6J5RBD6_9CAUD|nr:NADAR [uncultured Caudovirales phage]
MIAITSFSGQYRWLSNFYPCLVLFEGHLYPSVEHAYQAAKAHPSQRAPFRDPGVTASYAKKMGRAVPIPGAWGNVRVSVMRSCLISKFNDPGLMFLLLSTGDAELIEGNHWGDTFWGVCKGDGENQLGKLLMERRAFLAAL